MKKTERDQLNKMQSLVFSIPSVYNQQMTKNALMISSCKHFWSATHLNFYYTSGHTQLLKGNEIVIPNGSSSLHSLLASSSQDKPFDTFCNYLTYSPSVFLQTAKNVTTASFIQTTTETCKPSKFRHIPSSTPTARNRP